MTYNKGWTICVTIFIIGTILQLSVGKINLECFQFPINIILGTVFLVFGFGFHFLSNKIKKLRCFTTPTAAITSTVSLLFLIILMGLTKQLPATFDVSNQNILFRTGFMQMTVSWQFTLISLYFLAILWLIIIKRLSRFNLKDLGFIMNHLGLFIAHFAAILGNSDLQRLQISVPLNDAKMHAINEINKIVQLPFSIELNSFTIDEYPPKLMLIDKHTGEALPKKNPKIVSVEKTPSISELSEWKLEITKYFPSAAAIYNKDTIIFVEYHSDGATSALHVKATNVKNSTMQEGWISCGNFKFPFVDLPLNENVNLTMTTPDPKRFTSHITIKTKNGDTKDALIEVNKPLSIAGWKIYQTSYDVSKGKWSQYSVFELVKDQWLPIVYIGIGMLLIGSILLIFSKPNKIV